MWLAKQDVKNMDLQAWTDEHIANQSIQSSSSTNPHRRIVHCEFHIKYNWLLSFEIFVNFAHKKKNCKKLEYGEFSNGCQYTYIYSVTEMNMITIIWLLKVHPQPGLRFYNIQYFPFETIYNNTPIEYKLKKFLFPRRMATHFFICQ